MNLLVLDYETYFDRDYSLKKMSTPEYILNDKFEVFMLAAWDVKNWPAPRIIEGKDVPAFFAKYSPEDTIAVAHNALFDMSICSWRYGWVPKLMQDTLGMARALYKTKRYDLGSLAQELLGYNSKGGVLGKTIGKTVRQIKQAGLWPEMKTYAMNDVRLCAQIYSLLVTGDPRKGIPRFPTEERYIMDLVLRTTVQPTFHVDVPMLQKHLEDLRARKQELLTACGYDKAALMSTPMFQAALEKLGVEIELKMSATGRQIPAFAKTDKFMSDLLEYDEDDEEINLQVQTLAAARLSHKSTIEETRSERFLKVAQLPWMNGCRYPHCDGGPATGYCHVNCREHPNLIPMPLRYGGAHTHRLSGEWKMNVQNLIRSQKESKLRTSLIAPPGHKIVAADLSQIEARIVAVVANQYDLVTQFARGEDVYSIFASKVFGRHIDKKRDPNERFIGKTAILGLGYGCGWEKFHRMVVTSSRQYKIPIEGIFDIGVAQKTVLLYRHMFPKIPELWRRFDSQKFMLCDPASTGYSEISSSVGSFDFDGKLLSRNKSKKKFLPDWENRDATVEVKADTEWYYRGDDWVCLADTFAEPTDRSSVWKKKPNPYLTENSSMRGGYIELPNGLRINYKGVGADTIWGGVFTENVCQAYARIVIMQAAVRLHRLGYRFILQAHDELVFCVPENGVDEAKQTIMREMVRPVPWMPQLPLAAEIGVGDNYGECK